MQTLFNDQHLFCFSERKKSFDSGKITVIHIPFFNFEQLFNLKKNNCHRFWLVELSHAASHEICKNNLFHLAEHLIESGSTNRFARKKNHKSNYLLRIGIILRVIRYSKQNYSKCNISFLMQLLSRPFLPILNTLNTIQTQTNLLN